MKKYTTILLLFFSVLAYSQGNTYTDSAATALLQKVSDKYKTYKTISASFKLLVQQPKIKPTDDERKLTDTLNGQVLLDGAKFRILIKDQQIICDGKKVWTYIPADKQVQVNYFEESDDVFSPSKIFTFYKEGFSYQVKEKKTVGNKNMVVIEMSPTNRKSSYFKIDITIDATAMQIVESMIYEKNGVHYIYKLTKQTPNAPAPADSFIFDVKKYPGVKVDDLTE